MAGATGSCSGVGPTSCAPGQLSLHADLSSGPPRLLQAIFKKTPHDKQVMMFSATLSTDIRPVCKKFMRDVRAWAPAGGAWSAQTRLQCARQHAGRPGGAASARTYRYCALQRAKCSCCQWRWRAT